jgi:hypothetical protein
MAGSTVRAVTTYISNISHRMPTLKQKKNRRSSGCVEDMKKAMGPVLAAEMSVTEAAGRLNLPKTSLQDKISKMRKGSEVQVPPDLLRWHLLNEARCFFGLDYLPSHLTEIPQIGVYSGSLDQLRRLETTENMSVQKRCPLNSGSERQWEVMVDMLKRSSKNFAHFRCQQTKVPESKIKAERSEILTATPYKNKLRGKREETGEE